MIDRPSDNGLSAADLDAMIPLAYDDLRALAEHLLRRQPGPGPRATSLIHDVYVRLAARHPLPFESKGHFLRIAAKAMRYVLIDQVRRRTADKRGGGRRREALVDTIPIADTTNPDLLAVHEALTRLARFDPDKASIVELRFFGGLTIDETAATLGVSPATVKRHWDLARAWLYRELEESA